MRIQAHARVTVAAVLVLSGAGCLNVDGGVAYRFLGRVVDAATGRPLAGARVIVDLLRPASQAAAAPAAAGTAAADGSFALEAATGITRDGRDTAPPPPPPRSVYVTVCDRDGTLPLSIDVPATTAGDLGTIAVKRP